MSLDGNKKDFENALNELETTLSNIHHEISAFDYDVIETVINEYNGHYKSDIQELVDNVENISYTLEESKLEAPELQSALGDMEAKINELEIETLNKDR